MNRSALGGAIDRRPERLAALREALGRADLDGLLVSSLPNVRYLTGFTGSNALLLVTPLELMLFTDFRYAAQVEDEVGAHATVQIEANSLWAGLWARLAATTGVERIGFESAHLLHRDFSRLLEQGARWQWRPVVDCVEQLRECKDEGEVACIERAVAIAETALVRTFEQLRPGLTELAVAGLLEHQLRDAGSEGFPFETIVASGPRSALPHARASERVLAPGDFVLIDFGAIFAGYCADITRTVVLGPASARQREIHDIVREANVRASGAIRAEMQGMAADALAREYIDARGYGDAFGHSLGHGIGLEVHEGPRLSRSAEAPLAAGMVVTVEPGIYLPGWGGVRIEDDVLITADGARVLTRLDRRLTELS
ncbi:M24 family metallopeptidase [Gemmatimonas sp. UBA7669]|uniref:M24 family metallopeptidase n=1 Tax=Gemmatimonas sp. UBA7669 TaxID=1946568 RepID=UPI0025C1F5F8|nr:Xaa-Pro peptidase family protein [Gemmatimonas sp. UBA7669]